MGGTMSTLFSPESQGISSRTLLALLRAYDERLAFPHGFVFRRHGKIISEAYWAPYRADEKHQLFSLSKSFTSSAIGIAVGEGLLRLDDKILSFFPEYDTPAVGPLMRKVTLRHLLMMGCGHKECPAERFLSADPACDLVKSFLELEPTYEPGTKFAYNSIGTYMLSAALRKVTGQNLSEYLQPRLFAPLGIEPVYWEKCLHHGTDMGGWGLWLTTRDLSKAGQLWLDFGRWEGRQLIPEDYMREATSWQIQNGPSGWTDWCQGYGYQFWQCQQRCVRGDGAYGQFVVMDRKRDTVFAFHSALGDLQEPLTLLWDTVLFAEHDAPLPEDPAALAELRAFESSLRSPSATNPRPEHRPTTPVHPVNPLVAPTGEQTSDTNAATSATPATAATSATPATAATSATPATFGTSPKRWSVFPNALGLTSLSLAPRADGLDVTLVFSDRTATFFASPTAPADSVTELVDAGHPVTVSADYAWTGPDALRLVAIAPGMVNRFTFDFTFAPDGSATAAYDGCFWFLHGEREKAEFSLQPTQN